MSMFAKAKSVEAFAPSSKKGKAEVLMTGLKDYAEIDALVKALTALQKTMGGELKEFAADEFMEMTANIGHRPDNFKGVEGIASASMELRKRSSASPLTEEEINLLVAAGLTVEKKVSVNKLFGINPKFAEDQVLLARVEKALTGIVPEDFIVVQDERFTSTVSDETIDQAFRVKNMPRKLFDTVSTLAIKAKLTVTDLPVILESVKKLFAVPAKD